MSIRFNCCSQAEDIEHYIKAAIYGKVYTVSKKSRFAVVLLSPFVAISSAFLTVFVRIATIAEAFFKGLVNILACPFVKSCSLKRGVKQLCVLTTLNLCLLPLSVIKAVGTLIAIPLMLTIGPITNSHKLWKSHAELDEERLRQEHLLAQQKQTEANYELRAKEFDVQPEENIATLLEMSKLVLETNKEDRLALAYDYNKRAAVLGSPTALTYCAQALQHGKGVQKNNEAALILALQAYDDCRTYPEIIESAITCAELYREGVDENGSNFNKALQYYQIAVNHNDLSSMVALAELYFIGDSHLTKNISTGIEWFLAAAEKDDPYAKLCLAEIIKKMPAIYVDFPRLTQQYAEGLREEVEKATRKPTYSQMMLAAKQFVNQYIE